MEEQSNKKAGQPRKVRGTATFHDDMSVEFVPQGTGEPVQRNVRKCGEARLYETEGALNSSYVAHLKVSRRSEDPAAELEEQLEKLTKDLRKQPAPVPKRMKCLLDMPDVKVWHARKEKKVKVEMWVFTEALDMTATLLNLTSQVTKCFAINRTSLVPRKK